MHPTSYRWVDRTFNFTLPDALFPVVVERLRGTPARIEDKVWGLSREVLTRRDGAAWSIQEHIGHLLDLEELQEGRLDDYLAGTAVLRPADMENKKTWEAGHNERETGELLEAFRRERRRFVERLDGWDPDLVSLTAIHPRLKQPMRVLDLILFTAEHDDHHLTRMTELARRLGA